MDAHDSVLVRCGKRCTSLNDDVQIVGCELSQATDISRHSEDPYEEMAMRLIYHALNGPIHAGSMPVSVMQNRLAPMVLSGLITGAVSIHLVALELRKSVLRTQVFQH